MKGSPKTKFRPDPFNFLFYENFGQNIKKKTKQKKNKEYVNQSNKADYIQVECRAVGTGRGGSGGGVVATLEIRQRDYKALIHEFSVPQRFKGMYWNCIPQSKKAGCGTGIQDDCIDVLWYFFGCRVTF